MCVSQYTITDFRATTTDFIVLGTPSIYLIIQEQEKKKGWNAVKSQITTITEPFETTTWIILIFIVLPFFAILFVVHEFNVPGSVFKVEEQVVHYGHGEPHLLVREIRWYHHVPRVIVLGMMAVLQQDFAISVLSTGAQIHIIGFAFFTLTIVAVYTANLAAILTQRAAYREVKSLEDAINAGYRFCTERDTYFLIHKLHGTDPKAFIPDDDGLPGFNGRRNDVLNRIDNKKAAIDKNYCNAALSSTQDLVVLQAQGLLCDLKPVGVSVGQSFTGLPISGRVSEAVLPLFIQLNNDALYRTLLHDLAPQSVCPVSDADFSNDSLSIRELSGIWIISFGFAILGLIVRVACPMLRRRSSMVRVEPVLGYDQFFNSYKRVDFETVESVEVKEESIRRRLSKSSKSAWVIEQASFVEEFSDDESSDDAYPGLRGRKKKADFGAGFCKTLQLSQATEGTLTLTPIPEYDHTSWTNNVCNTEPRRLPQMQEEQKISISPSGRIDVSIPPLGPSKKDTPRMGESYRGRRILNEKNLSAHII